MDGRIAWLTPLGITNIIIFIFMYFIMRLMKESKILLFFFESFKEVMSSLKAVNFNLSIVERVKVIYYLSGFPICFLAGYLQSELN